MIVGILWRYFEPHFLKLRSRVVVCVATVEKNDDDLATVLDKVLIGFCADRIGICSDFPGDCAVQVTNIHDMVVENCEVLPVVRIISW